jgi:dTDP-glucose 4,6-dehydratase/UDP-glucuronate decarboxylase
MSSSEIYGDPEPAAIPTPETYHGNVSCTGPRACYDESKRFAETLAMIFFRSKKVPVRIVRPFNVYGPGMRLDDYRVLPDFARCMLEHKDIELFSDGSPTRSFCYVSDFIIGLIHVLVRGSSGEAYNVGNDQEEISIKDLARLMINLDGQNLKVKHQEHHDPEYLEDNPQRRAPDLSKLRALGYKPRINLSEGLPRYLAWARESKEIARISGAK